MPYSYPVLLDLTDRLIVIVGGGAVAARKARGVIDAGAASVRVVATQFVGEFAPTVQRISEPYAARHLDGAGLVFAATDAPAVNQQVVADARRLGILVSRVDGADDEPNDGDPFGDFIVPAVARHGAVTVAVSAGGSPALAAFIRDRIDESWNRGWSELAEVSQSVRRELRERRATVSADARRAVFRDLATPDALQLLQSGAGAESLRDWLRKRHPQVFASSPSSAADHAS
jgi:siroheme synthase-like protein